MAIEPSELKSRIGSGLLSFPVTHFARDGSFDEMAYREFLDEVVANGPAALFVAGGTGEFFSLSPSEFAAVVRAASETAAGRIPIIAGTGYGTALAIEYARAAQDAGADGLLLLPPYLISAEQVGLRRHVEAICNSVTIGTILYNRDNAIYSIETVGKLLDACPNLIGFKDGHGDIEQITTVTTTFGDRMVYVGGMPTAEVFAVPYHAAGVTTYSSAVFNFVPRLAHRFYNAVRAGDHATTDQLLKDFFFPYLSIRNRRNGYAVSIVKAGLRIVGKSAGPVRAPLVDLTPEEEAELRPIIERVLEAETVAA